MEDRLGYKVSKILFYLREFKSIVKNPFSNSYTWNEFMDRRLVSLRLAIKSGCIAEFHISVQ
jgi:hypothetical protein